MGEYVKLHGKNNSANGNETDIIIGRYLNYRFEHNLINEHLKVENSLHLETEEEAAEG